MENRDQLTARAYLCLAREGFHATGVERLAQQMGITKRTLYSHFESKDGLIEAVLDYRHTQFMQQIQAALTGLLPADIPAAYLAFIDRWTASPDFYGCLFINACAEYPDALSTARQQAQAHKQAVRELLGCSLGATQADLLFVVGEGLITAAHTGQSLPAGVREALLKSVEALSD